MPYRLWNISNDNRYNKSNALWDHIFAYTFKTFCHFDVASSPESWLISGQYTTNERRIWEVEWEEK